LELHRYRRQSLRNHCGIVAESLRNRCEIAAEFLRNHSEIDVQALWSRLTIAAKLQRSRLAITLSLLLNHFKANSKPLRMRILFATFANIARSFLNRFKITKRKDGFIKSNQATRTHLIVPAAGRVEGVHQGRHLLDAHLSAPHLHACDCVVIVW
jgi:hypothetical protein